MRDGGRGWAICTDRGSAHALSRKGLKFSRQKFPGPGMCRAPVLRKEKSTQEKIGVGGGSPDSKLQRLALGLRSNPRINIHRNRPERTTRSQPYYLPTYV